MRNFFYALVFVSLAGFGFFSALKSQAAGVSNQTAAKSYPYQIREIQPSGSEKITAGESINTDPTKIIPNLKVPYYPEDKISVFPDPKLGIGSTIKIDRAPVINIKDGKKVSVYRSWQKTVGELLAEKNIELGVDDKISVSTSAQIFDGSSVTITRVAKTNIIETKPVPFQIVKKDDPTLDKGKVRVLTAGVNGAKQLTYRVTREDGVEVGRVLVDTTVTVQPTSEVDDVGTKPVITVRCNYNDIVLAAAMKYGQDPNAICNLMMKESNGHADSVSSNGHYGLFQYDLGYWADASAKAGYSGAIWSSPTAQIYTTCHEFLLGYSGRW